MARIFLPLQVDFDDDEKVARLARYGRDARGCRDLLVGMWRYCKREQSDGHVPAEIVGKLVYPDTPKVGIRDADRLVEVGLAERTKTGYYLGGFLKHNKSREQIEAEAKKKAEAGSKGGKASGQVRRREADTKQGASPPRSHSSEDRGQRTETRDVSNSEGDRPVTLRAVAATEHTPEVRTPADARCTAHRGVKDPGPCNGCRAARERAERKAEAAEDRYEREQAELARDCVLCEGTHFVLDANKMPTRKKCTDHRRAS